MGAIKELRESYKDNNGEYPETNQELFSWYNATHNHESMKGGDRPTTALVVVAAPAVVAIVALATR